MALIREGNGLVSKPLVSSPEPTTVPRWDDDPTDLQDLQRAYDSVYGSVAQSYTPLSTVPKPTEYTANGSLTLPKPKLPDVRQMSDSLVTKAWDAKQAEKAQAAQDAKMAADRTKTIAGLAAKGSGMGLDAYGVEKSGLSSQRGSAPYGFQPEMWGALQSAFGDMEAAGIGRPGITDGWRSYESQVDVKRRKGNLAATPGRSVHGIGMAADLNLTPAQQKWLEANGSKYGLARLASEKWHWQYIPSRL